MRVKHNYNKPSVWTFIVGTILIYLLRNNIFKKKIIRRQTHLWCFHSFRFYMFSIIKILQYESWNRGNFKYAPPRYRKHLLNFTVTITILQVCEAFFHFPYSTAVLLQGTVNLRRTSQKLFTRSEAKYACFVKKFHKNPFCGGDSDACKQKDMKNAFSMSLTFVVDIM